MRDTGRIHIASIRFEHDAADTAVVYERMQFLRFVYGHLIKVDTKIARLGFLDAQLMLTLFCLREIKRAGLKNPTTLAGLCFKLFVELHCVVLQLGDIVVIMQSMDIGRRMPG